MKTMKISLILFAAAALIAGCSYGPTGILAGVELEREVVPIGVGVNLASVQSISVSNAVDKAIASGISLFYLREVESSGQQQWQSVNIDNAWSKAIGSLSAAISPDGSTIYAILFSADGTRAFSAPTSSLGASDSNADWTEIGADDLEGPQLLFGDTNSVFLVDKQGSKYSVFEVSDTSTPLLSDIPHPIQDTARINSQTYFLTSTQLFDSTGTPVAATADAAFSVSSGTLRFTGLAAFDTGTEHLVLSTSLGRIYMSDNAAANWKLVADAADDGAVPIEVNDNIVWLNDLVEIEDIMYVGARNYGYFQLDNLDYNGGTPNASIRRGTSLSVSNLLDTELYGDTITQFSAAPQNGSSQTGLFLATPNNGLWYGAKDSSGKVTWAPFVSE